jgi:hypothetical protein
MWIQSTKALHYALCRLHIFRDHSMLDKRQGEGFDTLFLFALPFTPYTYTLFLVRLIPVLCLAFTKAVVDLFAPAANHQFLTLF